jgi:cytochrome c556
MIIRSRFIAVLTAAVAVSGVVSAPALAKSHSPVKSVSHAKVAKKTLASKAAKGSGVVKPIHTGTSVVFISAFPTGGKGSGTEATCALWSDRLQDDQQIVDNAPEADQDDASGPLNADVNNALDAGCVVIY